MKLVLTAAALAVAAPAAHAQSSAQNASDASRQVVLAVGAVGESGLKATSGVVAIPLGAVALTSGAVGVAANASGYTEVGKAFEGGSEDFTKGARSLVEFSGAPLTVTDDVIVGQRKAANTEAQPAPTVPYTPAQ